MSKQKIRDEGREQKYFAIIPHIADEDLGPFEYKLYGHYKHVCGESETGACWESNRTTAEKCKMSSGKVTDARRSLEVKGYIKVQPGKGDKTCIVTLCDVMEENVKRMKLRSSGEQDASGVHQVNKSVQDMNTTIQDMNETVHQVKQRITIEEEHIEEKPIEEEQQQARANSEIQHPNAFELFQANIGELKPLVADSLKDALQTYPAGWVEDAIGVAATSGGRSWGYIQGILNRWDKEGRNDKASNRTSASPDLPDGSRYVSGDLAYAIEH